MNISLPGPTLSQRLTSGYFQTPTDRLMLQNQTWSLLPYLLLFIPVTLLPQLTFALEDPFKFDDFTSQMVDPQATKQTKALYQHLHQFARSSQFLFGHQDDPAYGVHWKREEGRSDVLESTGSYPAIYGWELSKIGQQPYNIDSVSFADMQRWMIEAYERGGINTISWHIDNPVTGGDSWDTTSAIPAILPGGEHHDWYRWKLDLFADFVNELESGTVFKKKVPIIFRPFHEHTGSWFWWGTTHCTPAQYQQLWRFTVEYLRDQKGLHQLIYAYSTDIFETEEQYLAFYPGDEYVDIMGMDDYHDISIHGDPKNLTRRLRMLVEIAEAHEKIPALTETGQEKIPDNYWWNRTLLGHIQADPVASRIAYVMVWRNARLSHHYVPYPGHPSRPDFVLFRHRDEVWFENDLPDVYRLR